MTERLRQAIVDVLDHKKLRERERIGEKTDRYYVVPTFTIVELTAAFQEQLVETEQGETD